AHAKGVVAIDSDTETAIWLTHSVPTYPHVLSENTYSYPDDELVYGQHMFCMSLEGENVDMIGRVFSYDMPHYYGVEMPSSLKAWAPNLYKAMVQDYHTTPAAGWAGSMTTRGGTTINAFAKNKNWNDDLWESLVAPAMSTDLYVESWGRPLDGPYCKGINGTYTVVNVRDVSGIYVHSITYVFMYIFICKHIHIHA
ncbi:deoxyribonuclease II, partial [Kipferlia bialata]